jgi:hypothetical protein
MIPDHEKLRRYIEETEPPIDRVVELWAGFQRTPQELDPEFMKWVRAGGFDEA